MKTAIVIVLVLLFIAFVACEKNYEYTTLHGIADYRVGAIIGTQESEGWELYDKTKVGKPRYVPPTLFEREDTEYYDLTFRKQL